MAVLKKQISYREEEIAMKSRRTKAVASLSALAGRSRIEGNNVVWNDRGIDVDAADNIIIGNTAGGNGANYAIVAGNTVGDILNFAGGGTMLSSNPWANFEY
jgi:parallel beta-helix repeat protein